MVENYRVIGVLATDNDCHEKSSLSLSISNLKVSKDALREKVLRQSTGNDGVRMHQALEGATNISGSSNRCPFSLANDRRKCK